MSEIIETYKGEGEFSFIGYIKKSKLQSEFELTQYDNGKIRVKLTLDSKNKDLSNIINLWYEALDKNKIATASLKGKVCSPDGQIFAKNMSFKNINTGNSEITIELDCIRKVEIKYDNYYQRKYHVEVGLTNFYFLDFIVELNNFDIKFTRKDDYHRIIKQLREEKNAKLTSKTTIILKKKKSPNLSTDIKIITKLLSYALRTDIEAIFEKYFCNGKLYKIILIPNITHTFVDNRFLISPYHEPHYNLPLFIETTYSNFKDYYEIFKFNLAIDYYLDSLRSNIIQNEFILAFICLEVILDNFEDYKKNKNEPLKNGIIKSNREKVEKIFNKHSISTFNEILDEIAKKLSPIKIPIDYKLTKFKEEFGIDIDKYDRELIVIRNKIIHTGEFPKKIQSGNSERELDNLKEIHRLIFLNDKLILSIIGYKRKCFHNIFKNFDLDYIE